MIKTFRDLQVYQESYRLMILVHKELIKLPIYERSDLSSQIRRASKSIPANIAEGWSKREHIKDFKHHLAIATGSANEMEVHIETVRDLRYWNNRFCNELLIRYKNLGGKLTNLKKNWNSL